MTALNQLIPEPHLTEIDSAYVSGTPAEVWEQVRHGELAQGWPVRALFALRTLLMPDAGGAAPTVRVDDLTSSEQSPGFQLLADDPPHECAVGAIGKVWHIQIPFVHVPDASAYAGFSDPGYVKVAWAIRVTPVERRDACRVEIEVRVHANDEASWRRFRRYFRLIGPFSRYIRRSLLRALGDGQGSRTNGPLVHPSAHQRGA